MRAQFFSICYRATRFIVTKTLYFFQAIFFIPHDLEPAVKFGDATLLAFTAVGTPLYNFKISSGNDVDIFGLRFPSPLVASSFKSETGILNIWLQMGLGGVILKTIMKDERLGNSRPRLQDASLDGEKGLLNSMGLPGQGVESFSAELPKNGLWDFDRPLGVSIGGNSLKEYVENVRVVNQALWGFAKPYFYELNISCPNTENGRTIGDDPTELESLLDQIRKIVTNPLSVKVSPDFSNEQLEQIGEICQSTDLMFINAGNTQFKMAIEVGINPRYFSKEGGGFSGPALFDRTIEMVKLFSKFDLPIMATGGISNIHHVRKLKNEGATLFGMATALVLDPYCIPKINGDL